MSRDSLWLESGPNMHQPVRLVGYEEKTWGLSPDKGAAGFGIHQQKHGCHRNTLEAVSQDAGISTLTIAPQEARRSAAICTESRPRQEVEAELGGAGK